MNLFFSGLFLILAIILLAFSLTSFINSGLYAFELPSHFQLHYLIFGAVFLIILIGVPFNTVVPILIVMLSLTINLVNLWPYIPLSKNIELKNTPSYSLLQANVFKFNFDAKPLLKMIKDTDPDIILLSEITRKWDRDLEPIVETYPYIYSVPKEGSHGMALYSKIPFNNARIEYVSDRGIPAFIIDYDDFQIISIHTLPPISQSFFDDRNQHFDWIERHVFDLATHPLIVAGDMNITMFAARYQKMIQRTNLINAKENRQIGASWFGLNQNLIGIPIDHFLHTIDIHVASSRVMPSIKSDHHPIYTQFSPIK